MTPLPMAGILLDNRWLVSFLEKLMPDHSNWMLRIVPTAFFLLVSVPTFAFAIRGVIPVLNGNPERIDRRKEPKKFWTNMSLFLVIAVLITTWFVAAWSLPLPKNDPAHQAMPQPPIP